VTAETPGFELYTVVHLIRPWGEPLADLQALRDALAAAPDEVLFHHTVQVQMRDPEAIELPSDDLSAWIRVVIQDPEVAERLSFAVQGRNRTPEEARTGLLAVLVGVPPALRAARRAPEGGALQLLSAESLAVPSGTEARDADALVVALTSGDPGRWFYHVLEAPWFARGVSAVAEWLAARGEPRLAEWLREEACPIRPIERARDRLRQRWHRSRLSRRVADASRAPADERIRAGRVAVANLVRRVKGKEETP